MMIQHVRMDTLAVQDVHGAQTSGVEEIGGSIRDPGAATSIGAEQKEARGL